MTKTRSRSGFVLVASFDIRPYDKEYIDIVADQSDVGMTIVGGTQEYSIRANWKLLAENSTDILHVTTLHPTYLDLVAVKWAAENDPSQYALSHLADLVGGAST